VTPDEARDLFGAVVDGELPAEKQKELDALLEADAALRAELDELRAVVREANALGAADADAPAPDLLAGVQTKLRKRSGGRFYRDRFSERSGRGGIGPIMLAVVMLFVLGAVYVVLQWTEVVEAPHVAAPPPRHG
jgi:anti-sigma factor RsiW